MIYKSLIVLLLAETIQDLIISEVELAHYKALILTMKKKKAKWCGPHYYCFDVCILRGCTLCPMLNKEQTTLQLWS